MAMAGAKVLIIVGGEATILEPDNRGGFTERPARLAQGLEASFTFDDTVVAAPLVRPSQHR